MNVNVLSTRLLYSSLSGNRAFMYCYVSNKSQYRRLDSTASFLLLFNTSFILSFGTLSYPLILIILSSFKSNFFCDISISQRSFFFSLNLLSRYFALSSFISFFKSIMILLSSFSYLILRVSGSMS